jgi:hypothetical protein
VTKLPALALTLALATASCAGHTGRSVIPLAPPPQYVAAPQTGADVITPERPSAFAQAPRVLSF